MESYIYFTTRNDAIEISSVRQQNEKNAVSDGRNIFTLRKLGRYDSARSSRHELSLHKFHILSPFAR